ncbi:MAG: metallophosphoesterase [Paludibacter sp.]|nr:metallophosphoesterase [Paludibacter sp.]
MFFFFMFAFTLLMTFYVTLRGWQVLADVGNLRYWYIGFNIILFLSLLAGMIFPNAMPQPVAKAVTFAGYSYMLIVIYLLLSFLMTDVVRILNLAFHFAPAGMKTLRLWMFAGSAAIIFVSMIIGNYKFNHPKVVHLNLTAEKPLQHKKIRIVAASDIHLGVSIDKSRLKKYVSLMNAQNPDIVLLAGDVSDRSTIPLVKQKMEEEFWQIKAPMGIYAVSGNHEYYSENPYATAQYLQKSGITFLRDSVALVDNDFYVVGRDDKTNHHRKTLAEIEKGIDPAKPVILLDHQPFNLEAAENNVDLQISGHTHDGQFFPGNWFVKRMYELGHGYLKKGKTHYYVSSGLGLWGPQYRIGTQSELVVIDFEY